MSFTVCLHVLLDERLYVIFVLMCFVLTTYITASVMQFRVLLKMMATIIPLIEIKMMGNVCHI